ncbi:MAG: hypothetical protein OXF50_10670 [Caldilineaceae bacterium]|nr:hypothetical protein [Caldilineaceae bacterium]
MSNVTGADRVSLEVIFGMESGYVLNFSDDSFEQFFDRYDVYIHGARYQTYGTSKANKLRAFWDQEPDELVGRVLFGLLEICEVLYSPEVLERDSVALQRSRTIAARLSGVSAEGDSQTGDGVPNREIEIPDIQSLPVDPAVFEVIQDRLEEAQTCLSAGAYLAAIFLCGSVLEAALLGAAQNEPEKFKRSLDSPKTSKGQVKNLRDWSLSQLIDVAYAEGLLKQDTQQFSHVLRNFRNYIHPERQLKEGFKPDKLTSEGCLHALTSALADLSGKR